MDKFGRTTFNPLIVTRDAECVIILFESHGDHHTGQERNGGFRKEKEIVEAAKTGQEDDIQDIVFTYR